MNSEVNQALVSKLAWKMFTNCNSLWVRVLQGKYVKGRDFGLVGMGRNASWVWKSIVKACPALSEGMCYSLGDGRSIHIWRDPWVPYLPRFLPQALDEAIRNSKVVTVSNLLMEDRRR